MLRRIRTHLTPGTVIALIALVFAITGGAFAATGGGGDSGSSGLGAPSRASVLASVAKSKAKTKTGPRGPAGPAGKNGVNGTNGAAGAQGPAGPQGPAGTNGTNGANGEKGTNGERGVTGEKGATGTQGSPWTAGGTLPSEKTETGTWSVSVPSCSGTCEGVETHHPFTMLSFPIPLPRPPAGQEAAFDASHVVYVGLLELYLGTESTQTKEECPSTIATKIGEEPLFEAKAAPGYLCVYESAEGAGGSAKGLQMEGNKAEATIEMPTRLNLGIHGAGAEGARLSFTSEGTGEHYAAGIWAVTAE